MDTSKEDCDDMKKFAIWGAAISLIVFVIDWGVIGLKLLEGDYDITLGAYLAVACLVIFFVCLMYIRFGQKCLHCGKSMQSNWKYCPHCGEEIFCSNTGIQAEKGTE